jgi:hypothetical protein
VGDVVIGEHPDHLTDRIALADVGEEFVAQSGAFRSALDDARDIDEGDRRMDDLFRSKHPREFAQPRVGQRHDTFVRLDRGERIVRRQHVVSRQRIEQRRLADIRKSDDSQVQAHRHQSLGDCDEPASSALTASPSNSRYGREVSAQRARSAVSADHRSAHPSIPGIPWWGAVLLAATFTAIGFAFDAGSGDKELSFVFATAYFIGCLAAVLVVRQHGIFTAVIQPPLLLFVSVPTAYFLFSGSQDAGIKDILINCGYPLIERFPLMFFTSAATLLVGMGRWYHGMSTRKAGPKAPAEEPAGAGLAATVSSKLSSLLSRPHDDDDDADEIDERPRRRRSAETSARKPAKRPAAPRSRHARPPETEIMQPVADRPRRSRSTTGRQGEPPAEPRRRPRPSSTTRRSVPPPAERRSGYERPERRRRPDDFAPREPHSTNGNGTHHPVSRVRYRGANDGDDGDVGGEYRPRRRTPRDRDADNWNYDI